MDRTECPSRVKTDNDYGMSYSFTIQLIRSPRQYHKLSARSKAH